MTPKEKAKELFDKYRDVSISFIDSIEGNGDMRMNNEDSKECALIAVDEILDFMFLSEIENSFWINYYNKVKQEIEKL